MPGDSLIRSGSAGMTSTIKPIKEGYLTKKGAVVGAIRLQVLVAGMFFFFFFSGLSIGHFTVVYLVAKPLIWSEAEGDLVVLET